MFDHCMTPNQPIFTFWAGRSSIKQTNITNINKNIHPIGPGSDPLATFAFRFAFASACGYMKVPKCIHIFSPLKK